MTGPVQFCIRRPVLTTMVSLATLLIGAIALRRLPVDLMPDVTDPTLTVSVAYENAAPQEMEELVARPIEEALSAVPGVEEVTSTSTEGSTSVRVSFSWGTDLDAAASDVRDRLDRIAGRLPDDADRPILRKFDIAAFPVMILGAGADLDPIEMKDLLDNQVKYRLERVPGVAGADTMGGYEREIQVTLDPARIKALGLPVNAILERIRRGNRTVPAGSVREADFNVTIRTQGEFANLDDVRDTVVATQAGAFIRVRDIGTVEDRWRRITRVVRIDGKPGVRIAINKQSGANTVAVAEGVQREIAALNRDLPQLHLAVIIDTSEYIRNAIANVGASAVQGGLLAVLVLLVFLRNIRSTAIIATAIPLSMVATFALLYFNGLTLNLMTLGGLALGVGMLVDNAIVVLENIRRLEEGGMSHAQAAEQGAHEVLGAVVSSTLTTVAVFLPLVFVEGMSGVMFKQLAMVVSFSLACSLLVAMTVIPMLAAHAPPNPRGLRGPWPAIAERIARALAGLDTAYRAGLARALNHRGRVLLAALALLGGALLLKPLIGVELMPATDEGEVRINLEMAPGTRIETLDTALKQIEDIVRRHVPEARNLVVSGGSGANPWQSRGGHTGQARIALVPQSRRARSSEQIAAALRPHLRAVPGATIRTRAGQGLFILRMGSAGDEKLQIEVRGHDFETADRLAAAVQARVAALPGITDARLSREPGAPEHRVFVNRARAADLGFTVGDIADTLETALGGTIAGYYRVAGKEYPIRVQFAGAQDGTLAAVLDLALQSGPERSIPFRAVVATETAQAPVVIERKNQERIVTVTANFTDQDLGGLIAEARAAIADISVPRDFAIVFAGDYEEQQQAFGELLLAIVLALILVYMVMACQFESLRDPLVVMFAVPLAAIGVLVVLALTRTTFNVQSYIGCIMLGGIVVNNAILLVDHTNLLRRRDGLPLRAAIEEAGRRRLRPILMTTLTTVLALLPLALGMGEGGEAQAPMARVVVGGLTSSTLITLFVVPVIYALFERGRRKAAATEVTP